MLKKLSGNEAAFRKFKEGDFCLVKFKLIPMIGAGKSSWLKIAMLPSFVVSLQTGLRRFCRPKVILWLCFKGGLQRAGRRRERVLPP
jgi:hypothetical protein